MMKKGKPMSIDKEVIAIVAEQLGRDPAEVTAEKAFFEDLDADSLDLTELVMTLEEKFEIEINDETAEKLKTVGDVIRFINSIKAGK